MSERLFHTDLMRFASSGHGTLRGPGVAALAPGDVVAITADGADTIEAVVLAVEGDTASVRARWDAVLRLAEETPPPTD